MRRLVLAAVLSLTAAPALAQQDHSQHAGHVMAPDTTPKGEPPPAPTDFAADQLFDPKVMADARAGLIAEHGAMRWRKVMIETLEVRPGEGAEGYGWDGQASFGGDVNRLALKSEGDAADGRLEKAEVQAVWSRAISPYFNLQAGVREDFEPRGRASAVVGVEGLAPLKFEVGAFAFLSEDGDVEGRLEGSYAFLLTQRLRLQPSVEANFGAGPMGLEAGLRLGYAVTPRLSPYVGVFHEDDGRKSDDRMVFGLSTFF